MNRVRNIIVITSYALLAALFFLGGYALGSIREIADTQKVQTQETEAVNLVSPVHEKYRLIIEDGRLNLYRVNGAVKELMAYDDISSEIFPKEDIEELKSGMEFDSLPAAQMLFENFVS